MSASVSAETTAAIERHLKSVKVPDKNAKVYREECLLSFATPQFASGLYTSLSDFGAFAKEFVPLHYGKTGNGLYLHQKWIKKIVKKTDEEMQAEKAQTPTVLGIGVDGGFNLDEEKIEWEKTNSLFIMPEELMVPLSDQLPMLIQQSTAAILAHDDSNKKEQVESWKEEIKPSKYADALIQLETNKKISPNPKDWACECCGATENLWLNLSDGYIGGGRKNWDGSGGCGAGLTHYQDSGGIYPLAVKLGTITPESADVFSYAPDENDMVIDEKIGEHLRHWGIDIMSMKKTEKTMAELQLDLNMNHDWSAITEDTEKLELKHGAHYVGIRNTGNSCYMNSLMQTALSIPEWQKTFLKPGKELFNQAAGNGVGAARDLFTQLSKLATALLTDKYQRVPDKKDQEVPDGFSVTPTMLRLLVGQGHVEFSTTAQQDVYEYYQHVLGLIEREEKKRKTKAEDSLVRLFTFAHEERLLCHQSNKVRYTIAGGQNTLALTIPVDQATNKAEVEAYEKSKEKEAEAKEAAGPDTKKSKTGADKDKPRLKVPFQACLQALEAPEKLPGYMSPATGKRGEASKWTRMKTFPKVLVLRMNRYVVGDNWQPVKINAEVDIPEQLNIEHLRSKGKQAGEEELPGDGAGAAAAEIVPDEQLVAVLSSMGFGVNACKRACIATKNASADAATEWLMTHMEDPDFNDPPASKPAAGAAQSTVDAEALMMLQALGFPDKACVKALKECGGSIERASDWLFSHPDAGNDDDDDAKGDNAEDDGKGEYEMFGIISHLGLNTTSGHYVCHIKKAGQWIIFNDQKVAVSKNPPFGLGFLYFFRRKA